ncbi:MAG: formylglycine-generating enzyme family protein [Myxococcales bacterium]|nr:formylglycine-generating enzyme family protein [Myxococcales bacterium]
MNHRHLALALSLLAGACYRHTRPDPRSPSVTEVASEQVPIPAGTLLMGDRNGDPSEYPEIRVSVRPFSIDRFEATNRQYRRCVDVKVCDPTPYLDHAVLGQADHPVVGVSWFDAEAYCTWLGRRLPTEAEWEYAAKGDDLRKWTWSGRFEEGRANGRSGDPFDLTAPVGSFSEGVSPFGVHDLSGNAAEWVQDWFDPTWYRTSQQKLDPRGPADGREKVVRGGSYRDVSHGLRVAARFGKSPTEIEDTLGFRCATDSPEN